MVGEYVNSKGILFATRKMDKKNISADFTDMALQTLHITDNKFGAFGQVVDIDIKVNDVDELNSDPHREQLQQIYNDQLRYNQEIVNVLQPIVNDESNHITDRLEQCLFNAKNYITPNIKYSSNTGNFEFAHITIYTAEEQRLTYCPEFCCKLRESFFLSCFSKAIIHICPLIIFAFCCCRQVFLCITNSC